MKDLLRISLSKGSCVLLIHFLVFAYKFPLIKWHLVKTLYISAMFPKHEKQSSNEGLREKQHSNLVNVTKLSYELIILKESKMSPTNVKSSSQAYPSNKPLGNWTRDLVLRVEQFAKWATTAHQPVIFWMSGFTFPTGFLTAVLQTCARQNNISVDSLSWEFVVSTVDDSNITQQPKVNLVSCWERGWAPLEELSASKFHEWFCA